MRRPTCKQYLSRFIRYDFETFSYHDTVNNTLISDVLSQEYEQAEASQLDLRDFGLLGLEEEDEEDNDTDSGTSMVM